MIIELSQTTKILILVALAIVAAGAGLFLLEQGTSGSKSATTAPLSSSHSHARAPLHAHATPVHQATVASTLASGLPGPLRSALMHSKLVVAVVYTPGDPIDAAVLAQVRAGAKKQHVKVVTLDVRKDAVAAATANLMKQPVEPAVLVTKRPGTIVVELNGYTDSGAVAQAIADARR